MGFVHHAARSLTGGSSTSLDALLTADLQTGIHYCWTANESEDKLYLHVFDASATDAESSPDIVRPDDYSTAGVWKLQSSPADSGAGLESGDVILCFDEVPRAGTLEFDGSAISRTTYAGIFARYGTLGGVGDGVNTFNLLDARGKFLRVFDNGAGNDPDAASRTDSGNGTTGDHPGTFQTSQNLEHYHGASSYPSQNGDGSNSAFASTGSGGAYAISTQRSGGTEARPDNISIMLCVVI